ncbi:hypothetical protein IEO21_08975 [Rhodonia placenta]|uniref:Retrotransposon Copia-like N-terminal domain-containing protein n=1 Tax=Rhodonia placenta TaxID=104341 RepID=A0A8H7NV85_9APHY|nr:hypothetical protein IEO21_08975 [Postia placenta]
MTTLYPAMNQPAVPKGQSNHLYDIPLLENEGGNFQQWKYRVGWVLRIRGLYPLIDGTEKDPGTTDLVLQEAWRLQNYKALTQITLTLKDKPLSSVMRMEIVKDAWDALNRRYEGVRKQTIAYLVSDLFRGTLSDEIALEDQLNAMLQKSQILASLGLILDESLIAVAMTANSTPRR